MALDPVLLIGILGLTVILGYVANLVFERTKVADVIWLLLLGVAISYFGVVSGEAFTPITPFLASVALLIILFDAGLNIDFYALLRGLSRSLLLAIMCFIFSIVAVAGVSVLLLGFDMLTGLLLGSITGGTSSAVVLGIIDKLRMCQGSRILVSLESILTDPLTIVASLAIMSFMVPISSVPVIQQIASKFSVGIVVGLFVGIAWLWILEKIKGRPFDYILTIGMAFAIYAGTEIAGGSGALSALFFGLALGNARTFSKILRLGRKYTTKRMLRRFQAEIAFFIRTFFFVLLGLIAVINQMYLFYGLAIAAVLVIARVFAVRISTIGMGMTRHELDIATAMAPRGLAAAVLAQLAASYNIPNADMLSSIIFVVIFATVIYTSAASLILSRTKCQRHREGSWLNK